MYSPKLGVLPHTQLPATTHPSRASRDGYSLEWVADGPGLNDYAAEIEQLQFRSLSTDMSVRPDWRATLTRPTGWADTVLFLRRHGTPEAAVFLHEKLVFGLRTGYFQGASTLGATLILCDAGREGFYLNLVTELLLNRSRGFLLLLQRPAENAPPLELTPRLQQRSTSSILNWELPLQPTLDATIQPFSHRTRRNIRSSLRYVEAQGWNFHPNLDSATLRLALRDLAGRCTHPFSLEHVEERLDVVLNTEGWFALGLTDRDGLWLCCLVGRRTPQTTEIFWQLNAAGYRGVSLCITMRSMMTREEVRRKSQLVQYIGGTCALSLPTEARYTAIARPGIRLWLLRILLRVGLPLGPVLRNVL